MAITHQIMLNQSTALISKLISEFKFQVSTEGVSNQSKLIRISVIELYNSLYTGFFRPIKLDHSQAPTATIAINNPEKYAMGK